MARHQDAQLILEKAFADILNVLGDDPKREGLIHTAKRAASSLLELTQSYEHSIDKLIHGGIFQANTDQMILVKNIEFYSLCEHHLLPFFGKCHIAYLPDQQILGLSKIPQIVHFYAKRLQTQETLTKNIAESLSKLISARGVAMTIEATHLCMNMRNPANQNTTLTTSITLGVFKHNVQLHQEFFHLIAN